MELKVLGNLLVILDREILQYPKAPQLFYKRNVEGLFYLIYKATEYIYY